MCLDGGLHSLMLLVAVCKYYLFNFRLIAPQFILQCIYYAKLTLDSLGNSYWKRWGISREHRFFIKWKRNQISPISWTKSPKPPRSGNASFSKMQIYLLCFYWSFTFRIHFRCFLLAHLWVGNDFQSMTSVLLWCPHYFFSSLLFLKIIIVFLS